jgi:tetratricopeptide (TPR) repeat protein
MEFARAKFKSGKIEEGKKLFHEVFAKTYELLGRNYNHHRMSAAYRQFADNLLNDCGNADEDINEAIVYYKKALDIRIQIYKSTTHSNLSNLYNGLKNAYEKLNKLDETAKYAHLLNSMITSPANNNNTAQINTTIDLALMIIKKCEFKPATFNPTTLKSDYRENRF